MAKEIERKFLVISNDYRNQCIVVRNIEQGYLNRDPDRTVRVRIVDERAFLTVKTRNKGSVRDEWEYEIPETDARKMLKKACTGVIIKRRFIVPGSGGLTWEVDEFISPLAPTIAEVELPCEASSVELPSWVGQEVTGDERFYNSNIGQ
ncbi:MAG: CYTH domain-containing protein [Muribaculaceae bacterium]|nr:CYTH domain-containing protein [Muribaculaceae bacterium]